MCVSHGGILTVMIYRDKIIAPYVTSYDVAIGQELFLMNDDSRSHQARIIEEYLGGQALALNLRTLMR